MQCLSCRREIHGTETLFFKKKLLLCPSCHALAESADRDVEAAFLRARGVADGLLLEHIMAGRLLQGGSGAPDIAVSLGEEPPCST